MAKKSFGSKSVVAGAGIRTASEQLMRQLEKSGVSRQVIGQLRAVLQQLPGGSLLKNAIRVWANKLDERVLAAVEPWLEELFRESESEETDMPPKGKKEKKGGGNPVDKALTLIDALDDARRLKLKGWLESYSVGVKNIILEKLSSRNAQSLKAFVQDLMVKEEGDSEVDLLKELNLTGSTELSAISGDASDAAVKARKVMSWVLKDAPETFKRILAIMQSSANDTTGDRNVFNEFLATFHSLEKEEAVAQLKIIAAKSTDVDERARVAGVRPNYVTMAVQLPARMLKSLRGSPIKPEALPNFLAVVNASRIARGKKEIKVQLPKISA